MIKLAQWKSVCYKNYNIVFVTDWEQTNGSKEVLMLEITEKAGEMIKDALKDKVPIPSIRVALNEGG